MLKFYGIRFNRNGAPERFSISFALGESLHAGLQIIEMHDADTAESIKVIDKEIEMLFQGSDLSNSNKRFRFLVAKWFRTKDIVSFLLNHRQTKALKLNIATVLDTRESIGDKWRKIETYIIDYLANLKVAERNEFLSDPESEINLILQMVGLFFMEQDDEIPPANLELQFIRYQFPRIIWKKKDGFNSSCNPFWLPKNLYCRSSYLLARIISKLYEKAANASTELQSLHLVKDVSPIAKEESAKKHSPALSYRELLPTESPDEIRLELDDLEEDNHQLSLIPESASETLLSLQKMIQKKFSHDGVKHLLGIFRQLAGAGKQGICSFDIDKHLALVARASKKGEYSDKQVTLFQQIFEILSKIKVKRIWNSAEEGKETTNPFILELYAECSNPSHCGSVKSLMLDPLFLPAKDNPFHLGIHLRLIPSALFREGMHKHALLPGLASYLTGTWLNEYLAKRGSTTKSTREIIEGCAFNITPASKSRIIDKLNSELAYMKEKCYISEYSCQENEDRNPLDDLHTITAPESVLAGIAEQMRVIEASSSAEKLIA